MLPEQQQRIMGYFIEEAKDHLNTIEQGLLNLQATIEDSEMANEVFRAAHSVKGGAAMLGIDSIQRTSHRLEDYFKILKESPIRVDRTLESMFLQVFDALSEQLENLQGPFGLTDEKAQEIMGGVEPVFDQISNHLNHLVANSDAAPAVAATPAAAPARATAPAKAARTEESALQLVFKSDVPGHLREMLALLKQPDNETSRQALKDLCSTLARQGEQFDLAAWCDLLKTAELAIANPDNTYRTLAPVLIKEIKHAQELVLGGREAEISASETLQDLMPEDVLDFAMGETDLALDQSFDNLLDDALSQPADPDPDFSDLFSSSEATSESIPEFDGGEADWLGLDQPTDDGELDFGDLDAPMAEAAADDLDFGDLDAPMAEAAADDLDLSTADGDLDLGDLDLDDLDADLDTGEPEGGGLEGSLEFDAPQSDDIPVDESDSGDFEAELNFDLPDQADGWDGLDLTEGDADSFEADLGEASDEFLGDLGELEDGGLGDGELGDGGLDNALDSDLDDLAAAAVETPRQGPEVGSAELNSLADLFEGDSDMLGNTWQEEVVGPEEPVLETSVSDSDDFSDLLGDTPDESDSPEADLGDLFGDELPEENAPDDGLADFDFGESAADADASLDDFDLPSEPTASAEPDLATSEAAVPPDLTADLFTDSTVAPDDVAPDDVAPDDVAPDDVALTDSMFATDEGEAEADLFSGDLDLTEADSAEVAVPDSSLAPDLASDIEDSGEDEFADLLSVGSTTPSDGAQSEVDAFFEDDLTDDGLMGSSSLDDSQNLGDLDDIFGDAGEDTAASLSLAADLGTEPTDAIAPEETDATWNSGDDLAVASATTAPAAAAEGDLGDDLAEIDDLWSEAEDDSVPDNSLDSLESDEVIDDSSAAFDGDDWGDLEAGSEGGVAVDSDVAMANANDAETDDDIEADLWDSTALSLETEAAPDAASESPDLDLDGDDFSGLFDDEAAADGDEIPAVESPSPEAEAGLFDDSADDDDFSGLFDEGDDLLDPAATDAIADDFDLATASETEEEDLEDLALFDQGDDAAEPAATGADPADADWNLGGELDGEEAEDEAGFGDWLDAAAEGDDLEADLDTASPEASEATSDVELEDFDLPADDAAEDAALGLEDASFDLEFDSGLSGETATETAFEGAEESLDGDLDLGDGFGNLFEAEDGLDDELDLEAPDLGAEAADLESPEPAGAEDELDDLFGDEGELSQAEEGAAAELDDLDLGLGSDESDDLDLGFGNDESGDLDELWGADEAEAAPDLDLANESDLSFEDEVAEPGATEAEQSDDLGALDLSPDDALTDFDGLDDLLLDDDSPAAVDAEPTEADLDFSTGDLGTEAEAELTSAAGADDDFGDLEALLDDDSAEAAIAPDVPASASASTAADDDSFDDLDALLNEDDSLDLSLNDSLDDEDEDDAEEEDEFGDLEKLLEEADQALGGTGKGLIRTAQPSLRRARSGGALGDQTMKVSVKHLDNLSNLVGELVVNRNTLEQDQERLRQFHDNLLFQVQQLNDVGQRMRDLYERSLLESSLMNSRQAYQLIGPSDGSPARTSHASGAVFDDLEMDRFTGFHTLSQEMIELIVRVRESASDIAYTVESSDQVTRQFRQVTTQLQEGLNKARMMPFSQTADRLPRAVRDISLKCGKEARLVVEGRDTLIDRMILDKLYDPMTHLVNNAIAHGIESPEVRAAAGKPVEGSIVVRAFYQGNQTVIYVADDGAGINPAVVKRKAIQKGLITPAQGDQMSDIEIIDLLFQPGFSTRDQADDISGRGVGMDVVRTELEKIRGVVSIDTNLGKGTSFTIRLPLTLSISKALTCISNQARIAFPMDGVEDMFDVPRDRVQQNDQGQSSILWRDTLLPFRPLSDLLQFNRSLGRGRVYGGNQDEEVISIVMLRSANTHIALQVDQVLGEQEIVIKQLEGPVPKPVGIAGATVLGDGRVMPIADVLELIDLSLGRVRREAGSSLWASDAQTPAAETQPVQTEPMVLIVDDSITVRELLSMSFNKVGYRVEQARDGQEAWEKLRSGLPCDLVFCDIEMPRMDGLELLSRIQKDPNLTGIPIAMLTSRGADRHRQMAVDLGASGYFTKPYLEEALLDAAQRMLNGERMAGIKPVEVAE